MFLCYNAEECNALHSYGVIKIPFNKTQDQFKFSSISFK